MTTLRLTPDPRPLHRAPPEGTGNVQELPTGHLVINGHGSEWGWSRLSSYTHCRRWSAFQRAGYQFGSTTALRTGSLTGTYLAHGLALQAALAGQGAILGTMGFCTPEVLRRLLPPEAAVHVLSIEHGATAQEAENAIRYGHSALTGIPMPGRLLGVEIPARLPLAAHLPDYTGYFDLAIEMPDGGIRVSDYKTTMVYGRGTIRDYDMSGQFYGYWHMARELWPGREVQIALRLVEKGAKEILRAAEMIVPLSPHVLREFPHVARDIMEEILREEARLGSSDPFAWRPRISGGSGQGCAGKYFQAGRCPAWEACYGGSGSFEALRARRM